MASQERNKDEFIVEKGYEPNTSRLGYFVIQLHPSGHSTNSKGNSHDLSWEAFWEQELKREVGDPDEGPAVAKAEFFSSIRKAGEYIRSQSADISHGVIITPREDIKIRAMNENGKASDDPFTTEELEELYYGFINGPAY